MAETSENCALCGKPVRSGQSGSLTQWIFYCGCDSAPTADDETSANDGSRTIKVCLNCGKRIGVGRSGTITQWIFRNEVCGCEAPEPIEKRVDEFVSNESENTVTDFSSQPELEVDGDSFPVERFAPLRILASTNESTVYQSIDRLLGTKVAVKVLKQGAFESLVQFQKGVKILADLNHGGIVEVLDFAVKDGTPYMVMEFVEGSTLREFLRSNGRLPLEDTLEIAGELCETLSYCHQRGVLHRDIKPENILICATESGSFEVKLLDFGLAFHLDSTIDKGMELAGTPTYMAPELGQGEPYSQRSEIYSLGCVLFELLSGCPPYEDSNPLLLLKAHSESEIPSISSKAPDLVLDIEVEEIVRKCIEKEPEFRFETPEQLLAALNFLSKTESAESESDPSGISNASSPGAQSNIGKRETILISLAVLAIVAMGSIALGLFFFGAPQEKKSAEPEISASEENEEKEVRRILEARKNKVYISFRGRTIYKKPLELVARYKLKGKLEFFGAKFGDPEDLLVLKDTLYSQISASMSNLSDRHLAVLLKMKHLTCIKASFTSLTSAGIKAISEYKNLDYLQLHEIVHDDDLRVLSAMPKLHTLQIQNCDITDRGLGYLSKCKTLLKLDIRACDKVTEDGVREFKKSVSDCKVFSPGEIVEPDL